MDRIIYTSMTGANAAAHRQAVLSNNLANVSTGGFPAPRCPPSARCRCRATAPRRACLRWRPPRATSMPRPVQRTGRNLDAMAVGNAWFAGAGLDGTEAYTRAGSFEGVGHGPAAHTPDCPCCRTAARPSTCRPVPMCRSGPDGTVTSRFQASPPRPLAASSWRRPRPKTRSNAATTGCSAALGDPMPNDANARMLSGALEGSNVNPVECMVGMIAASRQFEQQMKLLQTAETNDKTASQLLSMNG